MMMAHTQRVYTGILRTFFPPRPAYDGHIGRVYGGHQRPPVCRTDTIAAAPAYAAFAPDKHQHPGLHTDSLGLTDGRHLAPLCGSHRACADVDPLICREV